MEDKKQLVKLVAAMALGDGHLGWNEKKVSHNANHSRAVNSWYSSAHVISNRDYVEWQCSVLEHITSVSVREYEADGRNKAKLVYETRRHPFFTTLRERTYINGVKTVNPHDLKLFDAESLAILFMDDGWVENGGRVGIATHSFSWADNKLLRDCIAEKLNVHLDVRVHRQGHGNIAYYLRSNNEQGKKLRAVVAASALITPSFEYKLIEPSERSTPQIIVDDEIVSTTAK